MTECQPNEMKNACPFYITSYEHLSGETIRSFNSFCFY